MTRMITGQEQPDSGSLRLGDTVQIASVDQSRDSLDDNKTVWEEISDGLDMIKVGNYETSSRAYVGRFNFRGQDQQKKIGVLSGGERNRVHLAKMLKAGQRPRCRNPARARGSATRVSRFGDGDFS
jgi:ATPase subunit of ABC transporter with duplicated ATPase domains